MFLETRRGRGLLRDPHGSERSRRAFSDVSVRCRAQPEDKRSETRSMCPESSTELRIDYSFPKSPPYDCEASTPTAAANLRKWAVARGCPHGRGRRRRSEESTRACNKESSSSHRVFCESSAMPPVCSRSSLFLCDMYNPSASFSPATRSQHSRLEYFEVFGTPSGSQTSGDTPSRHLVPIHDTNLAGVEFMHDRSTEQIHGKLLDAADVGNRCKTPQACVQIALGPCQAAFSVDADYGGVDPSRNLQSEATAVTPNSLNSVTSVVEVSDEESCIMDDSFFLATFGWDPDQFASEDSHTSTGDVSADGLLFCGENHVLHVPMEARTAKTLESAMEYVQQKRSPKSNRSLAHPASLLNSPELDLSSSPVVDTAAKKCFCRAFNMSQEFHDFCHEDISPQGECGGTHYAALLWERASVMEELTGTS
ncbi:conserved hypothetical protein [Neospora caninum Liverpool]|uniref:Uncharacterized protein n=1 Tax=Neospora caninum (strain Liverpool) TaxID=572307 RepID=F0VPC9_NEOCL|nr:conserved hypothetical protein [Neospora caninum Liverpool]CBZ55575.1 conserved hypothetical protein [Neospora caninum Liverpool]CEL70317.1 TPA: hypothetical protein BN1204_060000 [Neospora caninum Liverpool]|eukprot:XP_003885603.1 conserved hypothetical protein [Neospora caninum Liverpool]